MTRKAVWLIRGSQVFSAFGRALAVPKAEKLAELLSLFECNGIHHFVAAVPAIPGRCPKLLPKASNFPVWTVYAPSLKIKHLTSLSSRVISIRRHVYSDSFQPVVRDPSRYDANHQNSRQGSDQE